MVFMKRVTVLSVILKASKNTSRSAGEVSLRKDLSLREKFNRISAETSLEATKVLYDPETLHHAGFRRAVCVCSPRLGHKTLKSSEPKR